jgi:DNA primase
MIDSMAREARMGIPEEKGRVARAVVKEIEKVPDAVARGEYLKEASQWLAIGEDVLRGIIERKEPDKDTEGQGLICPAEKRLFQILMDDRSVAPYVFAEASEEIFRGLQGESVFQYILDCFKNDREWNFHELKDRVPSTLLSQLSSAMFERGPGEAASVDAAQECIKAIRKIYLQNRLKDIQQKIAGSEKRGEKEEVLALLYQKQDITKQILSLA